MGRKIYLKLLDECGQIVQTWKNYNQMELQLTSNTIEESQFSNYNYFVFKLIFVEIVISRAYEDRVDRFYGFKTEVITTI